MKVLKRNGSLEDLNFNKIATRIRRLTNNLSNDVSSDAVAQKVVSSLYDNIPTQDIDSLSAEVAIGMMTDEIDYEKLATRITASNIQKKAPEKFYDGMTTMYNAGILSENTFEFIKDNYETLNSIIKKNRDQEINYFGLKTLERGYLTKVDGKLAETPQYLFLRVSCGIHSNLEDVKNTYNMMSQGYFVHATPTLFNAGTRKPQMSSCFLEALNEDSIDGIFDTLKKTAQISKWAGGIGLHIHNVRANNSKIEGTNGKSDGIIPMLRVFNNVARYVNQGGKRKGSVAVYLEPWHADINDFLDIRLNHGDEEARCRDLFTAMWIPDLFMERLRDNKEWSLFCPNEVRKVIGKDLSEVYGKEFNDMYERCEREGLARKVVKAEVVWKAILRSQIETGTPYMLYKDACNSKSNQKNIGTIKSSNLCTEILEVSNKDETAVCNLASIALPKFVDEKTGTFNFTKMGAVTRTLVRNLNKVIDLNFYPTECAENSNKKHRPIGLGVQGLADVFMMLDYPFDSEEARQLNKDIFENMYYYAMCESLDIAKECGAYESFKGSPLSEGVFQFDMWGVKPENLTLGIAKWDKLRDEIKQHGVRNSLLLAPMPTASTSQILGNNECFEPYTTNIYLRRTLAGEFVVVNKHLVNKLKKIDLWNKNVKDNIIRNGGSVMGLSEVDDKTKAIFKTVWETSQKVIIDMARDRGAFICQSQSMNLFLESPTMSKLSSMHMYAWKSGLKTGMYYLRSKAKSRPIQFTLEPCEMCSA